MQGGVKKYDKMQLISLLITIVLGVVSRKYGKTQLVAMLLTVILGVVSRKTPMTVSSNATNCVKGWWSIPDFQKTQLVAYCLLLTVAPPDEVSINTPPST